MFRLYATHSVGDFNCPCCNASLNVKWTTEYGDAIAGHHICSCPVCNETIKIDVDITITYTPSK